MRAGDQSALSLQPLGTTTLTFYLHFQLVLRTRYWTLVCIMERLCRPDIVTPVGRAQRVTTSYFLDNVLPPLPSELAVTDILASIRRYGKKSQRLITQQGRWRGFSEDPAKDTRDKQNIFVHFAAIIETISRAGAARGQTSNAKLVQRLVRRAEVPEEPDETTLPDGCIVPIGSDKETWEDIAAVGWYSKAADSAQAFKVSVPIYHRLFVPILRADCPTDATNPYSRHAQSATPIHVRLYCAQRNHGVLVYRPRAVYRV